MSDNNRSIRVLAPASLREGYVFDAAIGDQTFNVTVPSGGVTEGQLFEVRNPSEAEVVARTTAPVSAELNATAVAQDLDEAPTMITDTIKPPYGKAIRSNQVADLHSEGAAAETPQAAINNSSATPFEVPTEKWRTGFCDCLQLCYDCSGIIWMGYLCPYIGAGQILQRLKYSPWGQPSRNYKHTCKIYTILSISIPFIYYAYWGIIRQSGLFLLATGLIIFLAAGLMQARFKIRQRFQIHSECCENDPLNDCCFSFWCPCCAVVQMLQHTHDQIIYPYVFYSQTGLPECAPEII